MTAKNQLKEEGRHENAKPATDAQQKAEGRGDYAAPAAKSQINDEGRHEAHVSPGNVEPDPAALPAKPPATPPAAPSTR